MAALLALVLALPACSTVPSNSPTVQITQAPARPVDEIGIEPLPPEPGETPDDIVRGFIDAAASTRQGHPVAREHLAPESADTWSDEGAITIISPDYATVTTVAGSVAVSSEPSLPQAVRPAERARPTRSAAADRLPGQRDEEVMVVRR